MLPLPLPRVTCTPPTHPHHPSSMWSLSAASFPASPRAGSFTSSWDGTVMGTCTALCGDWITQEPADFLANHITLLWFSFARSLMFPVCSSCHSTHWRWLTYRVVFFNCLCVGPLSWASLLSFRLLSLLISKILLDPNILVYFISSFILPHFTPWCNLWLLVHHSIYHPLSKWPVFPTREWGRNRVAAISVGEATSSGAETLWGEARETFEEWMDSEGINNTLLIIQRKRWSSIHLCFYPEKCVNKLIPLCLFKPQSIL